MSYTPPSLDELLDRINEVKTKYTDKKNPNRTHAIEVLDTLATFIRDIQTQANIDKKTLHDVCLGAYVYYIESIRQEYPFGNPEYVEGYLYNKGSRLYSLLTRQLNIHEAMKNPDIAENKLSELNKLIYLSKFYNYIFKNDKPHRDSKGEELLDRLLQTQTPPATLQSGVLTVLTNIFKPFVNDVNNMTHGIPTEEAIHIKILGLEEDYLKEKEKTKPSIGLFGSTNPNRLFFIQLARAVTDIAKKMQNPPEESSSQIDFSHRVEIGAILYIMWMINNEYYVRSAANSALFRQCCKDLNVDSLKGLDHATQYECLNSFRTLLDDPNILKQIEGFGNKHYGVNSKLLKFDSAIIQIKKDLQKIIEPLAEQPTNWPATVKMAYIGSIIAKAPGYGAGAVLGIVATEQIHMNEPKRLVGTGINKIGVALVGRPWGNLLGFLTADLMIQNTIVRACATILQEFSSLVGYAAGGMIGFTFDLSYKGMRQLCVYYLHLCENLEPILLKNANIELVKCLLELPEEVFMLGEKLKIAATFEEYAPDLKLGSKLPELSLLFTPEKKALKDDEEEPLLPENRAVPA